MRINLRWISVGFALAMMAFIAFYYPLEITQSANRLVVAGTDSAAATVRFGVIGDFGLAGAAEASVTTLVKGWQPDFIVTVGDNNYYSGSAATIDQNIGQYYHDYIYPYLGMFGPDAPSQTNRFFPTLGNHDWELLTCKGGTCTGAYFDYFTLPNNERYYDFVQGPVHFFLLDSDAREPDGITSTSAQATWLRDKLAAAQEPWKLVFLHHSPYSSVPDDGATPKVRWPYAQWGATAVLSGHTHNYERVMRDGFAYFINGVGGVPIDGFGTPVTGSTVRYDGAHGAMLVAASESTLTLQFVNVANSVIDTYSLAAEPPAATPTNTPTLPVTTTPPAATLTNTPTPPVTDTPTSVATQIATPSETPGLYYFPQIIR